METGKNKNPVSPKNGVQGIFLVGISKKILNQKFVMVQDRDDRGTGTGVRKIGLPGGTIENGETEEIAFKREAEEEISLCVDMFGVKEVGCFTKLRQNGLTNYNTLFEVVLEKRPKRKTNDPKEVYKIIVLRLSKIINLYKSDAVHEGSIRLIFHYLKGSKWGSLNEKIEWNGYCF